MKNFLLLIGILLAGTSVEAQLNFSDRAGQCGINHRYLSSLLGGGVSFYDFNQDGLDDLSLANAQGDPVQFYQNMYGHFMLLSPLVDNEDEVKQLLWVDFDNDGDQDLFLATYYGLNRLYENTGDLQMTDITLAAGLPTFNTQTFGACFGDYDRDGWVDLYFSVRNDGADDEHLFFRNNGNQTFTNVTESTQTADTGGRPFCSGFLDYNQDGYPDIMVINLYPFYAQLWSSPPLEHHWVKVSLQGVISNRNGIGTRLECYANGRYQQLYTQCGNGFIEVKQRKAVLLVLIFTSCLLASIICY